jgi:hypothetical protein
VSRGRYARGLLCLVSIDYIMCLQQCRTGIHIAIALPVAARMLPAPMKAGAAVVFSDMSDPRVREYELPWWKW